ncbi:MAG: TetR family transcriptional regulator [Kordiimonadaceae bacterium]|nr:TetR family transcriptional regulator [Kordiimonadaceae bacterium]
MSASKKDELVQKALKVFYREGFHATGMDRLVAETKISKTSMYKHFGSKDDLILATLKLRDQQFRDSFIGFVENAASDPVEKLLATFDALADWFGQTDFQSCMFIKASSEFQDTNHPAHKEAAEHKLVLQTYLKELAEEAGLTNPASLAIQLQLLQEGAIVLAHMHTNEDPAADAKNAARALIAGAQPAT